MSDLRVHKTENSLQDVTVPTDLVRQAQETAKPNYNKWLLIAVAVMLALVALPLISGCSSSSSEEAAEEIDYNALPLGTTIELDDGLRVSVDAVQTGLIKYDGSEVCCVTVSYENTSDKEQSYNALTDWKVQDAQGVQTSYTYYNDAENELHSGKLASGGTITGNVYFDGVPVKVLYYSSAFGDSTAAWVV